MFMRVNTTWDDTQPNNGADFAPQLGLSSVKVQTNDSRIGNVVYRDDHLWFAHTVFLPAGGSPTHSAVQWWQLNPSVGLAQFGRIEDTTGSNYYAFPSIAVNRFNDVLIGFSRYSSNQYISANYAFRAFNDPANVMQTERVFKAERTAIGNVTAAAETDGATTALHVSTRSMIVTSGQCNNTARPMLAHWSTVRVVGRFGGRMSQ